MRRKNGSIQKVTGGISDDMRRSSKPYFSEKAIKHPSSVKVGGKSGLREIRDLKKWTERVIK